MPAWQLSSVLCSRGDLPPKRLSTNQIVQIYFCGTQHRELNTYIRHRFLLALGLYRHRIQPKIAKWLHPFRMPFPFQLNSQGLDQSHHYQSWTFR